MKILKFIRFVSCAGGILILLLCILLFFTTRGPYRNIKVDITLPSDGNWKDSSPLEVGVGVKDITPDLSQYDTWVDVDNDGSFNPELDRYEDRNHNGEFDFVWFDCGGADEYEKFMEEYWDICNGYVFFHFTFTKGVPNANFNVLFPRLSNVEGLINIIEPHKFRQGSVTMIKKSALRA